MEALLTDFNHRLKIKNSLFFRQELTGKGCYGKLLLPAKQVRRVSENQLAVKWPSSLRKEVRTMPITLTFHIFGYVITIRVKRESRHSAK